MEPNDRIADISTHWTLIRQAHNPKSEVAKPYLHQLFDRYAGAVRRYLFASLRDEDAVNEVFQEFSLRLVRGAFHNADPSRGRFRDLIKSAVVNLVIDYRRNHHPRFDPLPADVCDREATDIAEDEFKTCWREELFQNTWKALAEYQEKSKSPYYTLLRYRVDHPDISIEQLAEQLSVQIGKQLNVQAMRALLHRARDRFADLLLQEVAESVTTRAALAEELDALGLSGYCKAALARLREPLGVSA